MKNQIRLLAILFFLSGCIGRQAYYVSPFNGLSPQYRSMPLKSDSLKSATYLNATLSVGGDNESGTDTKFSFFSGISRVHQFGNFQGRYGAGVSIGSYKMKPYDSVGNHATVDHNIINSNTGTYFFGGASFEGAVNFVQSYGRSEWRVLGMETAIFHEFGDYFQMRKSLPYHAATVIIRNRFYGTGGLFTEYLGSAGETRIGGKFGGGFSLSKPYRNVPYPDSYFFSAPVRYRYYSLTFHLSQNRWTTYCQGIFSGKSNNFLLGLNFRL